MTWWWCSFADGERPKGTQFLGVAIVEGDNIAECAFRAHMLGINPGGEVLGAPILLEHLIPGPEWRDRLLNRGEAEALAESMDAARH